jgi:hypothetical protein
MLMSHSEEAIQTLDIVKDIEVAASIEIVFQTILEQMGPNNEKPDGTPWPMKIEPWPGGRWYRDLGKNSGHLWGHVQSINPPTLLEIYGPLFMSSPVTSHLLYRLSSEAGATRLKFSHRAIGQIAPEFRDGVNVNKGWGSLIERIRVVAEKNQRR